MKKMILSLATVMMMGFSVFANGTNNVVTQEARDAFKKDFATASDIRWEQTRNITSDQLPLNLLTGLRGNYADYWITDLFEISSNGQTTYYATVENSDKKIVLKSDDLSSWEVYSKEKKAETAK